MSYGTALQAAIFSALDGSSTLASALADHVDATLAGKKGIYDHQLQVSNTGNDDRFPYISLGDDQYSAWDTDSDNGTDAEISIHCWSRYRGFKEILSIQGIIYSILHRSSLSVTGNNFVMMDWIDDVKFIDSDGLTRHGISRYRVLMEESS